MFISSRMSQETANSYWSFSPDKAQDSNRACNWLPTRNHIEQTAKNEKISHLQSRAKRLLYLSGSSLWIEQNWPSTFTSQPNTASQFKLYIDPHRVISKASEESVRQSVHKSMKSKLFFVSGVRKTTQIYVLILQMFASLGANGPKSTKARPIARRIVVATLVLLAMLADCDSPWHEDCASCDSMASGLLLH